MPISVGWSDPAESTVYIECVGKWTWTESYQLAYALFEEARNHPFDVIVDMRHAATLPTASDNQCVHTTLEDAPQGFGLVVLVAPDRFTSLVVSIAQKHSPVVARRLVIARTMDEAHAILQERRSAHAG